MYEDRYYAIFSVTELDTINFTQVLETNVDTVRKSTDQQKTLVKWYDTTPECVQSLTTLDGIYTHEEIIVILATPEWTDPGEM